MSDTLISSLASNGPWALASAILLNQIIKAWTNDRQQIATLLTEFRDAINGLKDAVEKLNRNN